HVDVDKRKVPLKDDIKNLGEYEAEIKLYSGITANCTISVEKA
ncbi:MAG: 50S ribosomal protein L9, partial [Ruminococcus sp.]|nr:50S ribosomal protein L9 [Ruminococcus sp.]